MLLDSYQQEWSSFNPDSKLRHLTSDPEKHILITEGQQDYQSSSLWVIQMERKGEKRYKAASLHCSFVYCKLQKQRWLDEPLVFVIYSLGSPCFHGSKSLLTGSIQLIIISMGLSKPWSVLKPKGLLSIFWKAKPSGNFFGKRCSGFPNYPNRFWFWDSEVQTSHAYPFQSWVDFRRQRCCNWWLILTKLLWNKADFLAKITCNLFSPNQTEESKNLSMESPKTDFEKMGEMGKMLRLLQVGKLM